jgi:hypothetical protein
MASILLVSRIGDGCSLALRLAQEGHIVKYWISEEESRGPLQGYKNPSSIKDPKVMLEQYDLILGDVTGLGALLDTFKDKGKYVLGGGSFNDKLELDQEYSIKVASSLLGLSIPDGPVDGIEVEAGGWFNGEDFLSMYNHTFKKRRFMEGDKGYKTTCMGNVVFLTEMDKLTQVAIEPLKPLLRKVNYIGPISTNCIISSEGAYFLNFIAGFSYNTLEALLELVKGSTFDFLYRVASASKIPVNWRMQEVAIAVRLSLPPWPYKNTEEANSLRGVKVLDIPESAQHHIWLSDVMLQGVPVMAGVSGLIGCATAYGASLREAKRRVYRTVDNVVIHRDIQYRRDIGEDIERQVKLLTEWGWFNASIS